MADGSCHTGHGLNGINRTPKLPHIAGQRAEYLYLKGRKSEKGEVKNPLMQNAVDYLTDDAQREAAL